MSTTVGVKLKFCDGCQKPRRIWKSKGREKYCQPCWLKKNPVKSIAPKGVKKIEEDKLYLELRTDFFSKDENQICCAQLPVCTYQATDVHHARGRGIYLLATNTWKPVCRSCHDWIEEHPKEATILELSASRLSINSNNENEKENQSPFL